MSNEETSKIYTKQVESHGGSGKIKPDDVNYDHAGNPRKYEPLKIIDHRDARNGKIDKRSYYDESGNLYLELHSTNHGNAKKHPFGNNGEHAHDIEWQDGLPKHKKGRELTETERKDNGDIL